MIPDPQTKLLFGDLLALARERWVHEMARRLDVLGFDDYRRSDALVLRVLQRGEVPLGSLSATLGLTRQGARKVVSGLVERGYADVVTSSDDARRRSVELTPKGRAYGDVVVSTLRALHDQVVEGVDTENLAGAYAVLQYVKDQFGASPQRSGFAATGEF